MFGWEFPPFNSGGLGVACQGLVGGLAKKGADVTFVLPKPVACQSDYCRFVFPGGSKNIRVRKVNALLSPYLRQKTYVSCYRELKKRKKSDIYARDLVSEVFRYAFEAGNIAKDGYFNVIHCHDWLSFPAGLAAKAATRKPLVFHVHATEYDRVGGDSMNREIYMIEKEGFLKADAIIAVSDYTKRVIVEHYGVKEDRVSVVPNAIDHSIHEERFEPHHFERNGKKVVLFVGRLTYQKGPDYFLRAAKRVLETDPDVFFVFSGAGDMERWLIEEAARQGISDKVFFAGFMRGRDLSRLYRMADLYVMSSVSEPFGLTSLEAMANGAPVLVSRTSGASEMISHCLKVDFWDVEQMAAKILAVTRYPELGRTLSENGAGEVKKFSWDDSARKCLDIYQRVMTA